MFKHSYIKSAESGGINVLPFFLFFVQSMSFAKVCKERRSVLSLYLVDHDQYC